MLLISNAVTRRFSFAGETTVPLQLGFVAAKHVLIVPDGKTVAIYQPARGIE